MSLNQALVNTENKIVNLKNEINFLENTYSKTTETPSVEWGEQRLGQFQALLEQKTSQSAMALRNLLEPVELQPITRNFGKPYFIAHTSFETISNLEDRFAPALEVNGAN